MSLPSPQSPLRDVLRPSHSGAESQTGVALVERRLAIAQVQARKARETELAAAISSSFGLSLPAPGGASTGRDGTAAIWIGPATWLILAPRTAPGTLAQRLAAAVSDTGSVTDQTFGKALLRLSGAKARDVLAKGCRVDLNPRVFGPRRAAVTSIGHIGCVLAQVDEVPTFDLVVPATLAASFVEWLEAAAAEFGLDIEAPTG